MGMNKKGVSIAIVVLVLMTLVIIGAILYIFITHSDKIGTEIGDARVLNDFYLRENEINFYAYNIMENAALKTGKQGKLEVSNFVKNFKEELNNYKDDKGVYIFDFLSVIENQVSEKNVVIKDRKVSMNLGIKFSKDFGKLSVSYLYNKEFVVDMK